MRTFCSRRPVLNHIIHKRIVSIISFTTTKNKSVITTTLKPNKQSELRSSKKLSPGRGIPETDTEDRRVATRGTAGVRYLEYGFRVDNATCARVHVYTSAATVACEKSFRVLCLVVHDRARIAIPRQSMMLHRRKTLPIEMIVHSTEYPCSAIAAAGVVRVRAALTYRNKSVFRVKSVKID